MIDQHLIAVDGRVLLVMLCKDALVVVPCTIYGQEQHIAYDPLKIRRVDPHQRPLNFYPLIEHETELMRLLKAGQER